MTTQEKLAMLEEIMELESGSLNAGTKLEDLEEWNSMAALALIALMDEEFNKILTGKQIKEFKTVQDILDFME
ncbi:MAG: acyl carrier protein [Firmicutes bacterium]|nr:acyl carrier protein [Bacillota bacterium]